MSYLHELISLTTTHILNKNDFRTSYQGTFENLIKFHELFEDALYWASIGDKSAKRARTNEHIRG